MENLMENLWKDYGKPQGEFNHSLLCSYSLHYFDYRHSFVNSPWSFPQPYHKFTTRFTTAVFKSVIRFPTVPTGATNTAIYYIKSFMYKAK